MQGGQGRSKRIFYHEEETLSDRVAEERRRRARSSADPEISSVPETRPRNSPPIWRGRNTGLVLRRARASRPLLSADELQQLPISDRSTDDGAPAEGNDDDDPQGASIADRGRRTSRSRSPSISVALRTVPTYVLLEEIFFRCVRNESQGDMD